MIPALLTALLFCLSDPMAQGVATAAEVRECCRSESLGLTGRQRAAAQRLSTAQVQLHLNELAATPSNPIRRTGGGYSM